MFKSITLALIVTSALALAPILHMEQSHQHQIN